jgi:hypothetical protein
MHLGQKISEETRAKMRIAAQKRGNNRGSGWKLSEEHKKKIGLANKVSVKKYFETHDTWSKGKHYKIKDTSNMHHTSWNKGLTGPINSRWKGGITDKNNLERRKFAKTIGQAVLKRDNYACVLCGSGKYLQVDHIQKWSDYIELRFDINNCRTLCMDCHYFITYGKKKPEGIMWGNIIIEKEVSLSVH